MSKHLYLAILLTFVTGFAAGMYVYFVTRNSGDDTDSVTISQRGYEIVVSTYGGCERIGCSSIRLTHTGEYVYLVSALGGGYERHEDAISSRQLDTLDTLMESTPFESIESSTFVGTCPVTYDGLAYRFSIRYETAQYEFDSCRESLDSAPLFDELTNYFDIMSATYEAP